MGWKTNHTGHFGMRREKTGGVLEGCTPISYATIQDWTFSCSPEGISKEVRTHETMWKVSVKTLVAEQGVRDKNVNRIPGGGS